MRHELHDTRKYLRHLSRMTDAPILRAQLEAASEHWHELPAEERTVLAAGAFSAELAPNLRARRPVEPGQ